jgi:hypothetical protein
MERGLRRDRNSPKTDSERKANVRLKSVQRFLVKSQWKFQMMKQLNLVQI